MCITCVVIIVPEHIVLGMCHVDIHMSMYVYVHIHHHMYYSSIHYMLPSHFWYDSSILSEFYLLQGGGEHSGFRTHPQAPPPSKKNILSLLLYELLTRCLVAQYIAINAIGKGSLMWHV